MFWLYNADVETLLKLKKPLKKCSCIYFVPLNPYLCKFTQKTNRYMYKPKRKNFPSINDLETFKCTVTN